MEKNISGLLITLSVIFLALGFLAYNVGIGNGINSVEIPASETCPEVITPEAEVIYIANASLYKANAVDDFLDHVDDEELYECKDYEYNFDEISINKVYDSYTVSIDDDEYTVEFSVQLIFDDNDERACKKTFDVIAEYEESEDTEFIIA